MKELYTNGTDRWLTPPDIFHILGPFDTDPCCERVMPWRTAKKMIALPMDYGNEVPHGVPADVLGDGLVEPWEGRVFMNHPYSEGLPWARRMVAHPGGGIALTASKSLDTKWGQLLLRTCTAVLFPAGRILFYYPSGVKSAGKWLPNAFWAFGEKEAARLAALRIAYPGVLMRREP